MELHADFTAPAVVHAARLDWTASPMPGVERRMLDRVGGEVARATSIVRYAPASAFSAHIHGGGEEFLVLDGVFQDEHGDFPAGTYVRNPPTTRHTPGSAAGCTIFVKLWQFDPSDRTPVRIDTAAAAYAPIRPGALASVLFQAADETVRMERWAPGAVIGWTPQGGAELLVIEGGFDAGERFGPQSWWRLPPGAPVSAVAGPHGALVWIKTGHLARPRGVVSTQA